MKIIPSIERKVEKTQERFCVQTFGIRNKTHWKPKQQRHYGPSPWVISHCTDIAWMCGRYHLLWRKTREYGVLGISEGGEQQKEAAAKAKYYLGLFS